VQLTDADFTTFCQHEADITDALEAAVEVDAVTVRTHPSRVALVIVYKRQQQPHRVL